MKLSRHLMVSSLIRLVVGVWEEDFKNIYLRLLYNAYYTICYCSVAMYSLSLGIQTCLLVYNKNYDELMSNVSVFLPVTISIFRVHLCRTTDLQNLLKSIHKIEAEIFDSDDEVIKNIYRKYAWISNVSAVLQYLNSQIIIASVILFPAIPVLSSKDEELPPKVLPISCYMFFDKYEHATVARTIQAIITVFDGVYGISTDSVMYGLMIHSVGQLKILQHYFENIYEYAEDFQKKEAITLDEAQIEVARKYIELYNEIIKSVNIVDRTLRYYMLFNFFQTSFRLAVLVLIVLEGQSGWEDVIYTLTYLNYEFIGIYNFFWNANEVLVGSSEGLSQAIFKGKWYLCNDRVKKALMLTILRTNRPCKLSIGPFYDMDLTAAINMLRACYCYICTVHDFGN